ncbi:hypothetical protein CN918_30520 [Priestia megaterium]|nr:hypothetical protein CN918_30520 [Priestia megaterium]
MEHSKRTKEEFHARNKVISISMFGAWLALTIMNIALKEAPINILMFVVVGIITFPLSFWYIWRKKAVIFTAYWYQICGFLLISGLLFLDTTFNVYNFLYFMLISSLLYQDRNLVRASSLLSFAIATCFFFYRKGSLYGEHEATNFDYFYQATSFIVVILVLVTVQKYFENLRKDWDTSKNEAITRREVIETNMDSTLNSVKVMNEHGNVLKQRIRETENITDYLLEGFENVSRGNNTTAENTNDISTSMNQVNDAIKEMNQYSSLLVEKSKETARVSQLSEEDVEQLKQQHAVLANFVEENADLLHNLTKRNEKVSNIISIIEGISAQTNLLALNASIEAARAGEHGKGFAVVASEVKKLADSSQEQTQLISDILSDIQEQTLLANEKAMAGQEALQTTKEGTEKVSQSFALITSNTLETLDLAEKNKTRTSEIQRNSGDITESLLALSSTSEEISTQSEEMVLSVEKLRNGVNDITTNFKELENEMNSLAE